MPDAVEIVDHRLGQRDAVLRQQAIEDAAVQAVDGGPRQFAAAHLVHGLRVAGPPGIGEGRPVDREAVARGQRLAFAHDRRTPVDDGAEDVEDQRPDRAGVEAHLAVGLGWLSSTLTVNLPSRMACSLALTLATRSAGTLPSKLPSGASSLPLCFIIE